MSDCDHHWPTWFWGLCIGLMASGFVAGAAVEHHMMRDGAEAKRPPCAEHREWCEETCSGLDAERMRHLHGTPGHRDQLVCRCATRAGRILFAPRRGGGWVVDPRR